MICGPVELLLPQPDSECVECDESAILCVFHHIFYVLLSDRRVKMSRAWTWSKEETECLLDIGPKYPIHIPLYSMLSQDSFSPDGLTMCC